MGWSHSFVLTLVCLIGFTWQCAWGIIPWVYPSEIFTMAERDRATSLAVFVQYGANALLMPVVPSLMGQVGAGGMLLFFAAFNVLNFLFTFTCIKETKGVPLEAVPALFGASTRTLKIDIVATPNFEPETRENGSESKSGIGKSPLLMP